ncbi:bestrophin-2 [Asbolus verrucosus]|uniref:Bestrophin-2 n=1 Tax=Asbolus verrucosus TaxID=1661398 RepID=A0A482W197_ASBVE|nr:bestrophin-2 [Asbolus verrucosus]
MTVTYTAEVATCRGLGCFLKLLRRWKGSIYKLVWIDLIVFLFVYYSLNFIYRFLLDDTGKELFESIVRYCKEYSNLIPLSFVLGFYVSIVMTRWWNQYTSIPFPDPLAVFVSATVHGQDERGRVMRRTIMRYVCLCVTMMFAMISPRVKKRFPTLDHFIEAGLLQQSEKDIIAELNKKLPIVWAASIITRARKEGRIRDDFAVKTIIDELNKFRGQCGLLLSYDMISVPLVYTQVVTLAVYSYFLTTLMGQQWVEGNEYKFDLYFPVFTTLQFFFYVGWLKVAESLINPFGDDDDDFEVNWMVDRNLQVSYLIVDEMHHDHPELVRDQYWDEVFPQQLPYTVSSAKENHPLPSTANISVHPNVGSDLIGPSSLKIDELNMVNDMNSGPITFSAKPARGSSQTSMAMGSSVPDSRPISRTSSVTSMLKRFLSREDKDKPKQEEAQELTQVSVKNPPSVKKFTTDVIEEVDEQTTLTSQRDAKETRPSVLGLFGPPPPSDPISVPSSNSHSRSVYDPYPLSTSAPVTQDDYKDTTDDVSIGSSGSEKDEFIELKKKRDEERLSRLKLNLMRSISVTPNEDGNECDSWKGSIYKLVYIELIFFLFIYYTLNITYRFLLNERGRGFFEEIVSYCNASNNYIPLSFVLGFYVAIVMARWWNQYCSIPFPDPIAVYVSATIHGNDEHGRVMRRTIMRYVCLCVTMLFTNISPKVKKRFPTLDHFIEAGLLENSEKEVIQGLNKKFPAYSKHWLPLVWAASIITRARKEGRIRDDFAVKTILDEINKFRGKCGLLVTFDRISIPLVYTQVVTLAVYTYFLSALMGRQCVDGHGYSVDLYFPIFTLLQFFFYMGWLKVAETLINPFGDDDDDFELNWMVDRNLQISYLIVDEMHHEHPELIKDQYWDTVLPEKLPYTPETEQYREMHPLPSTANLISKYEDDLIGSSMYKINDLGNFKSSQYSLAGSPKNLTTRTNSVTSLLRKFIRSESLSNDPEHEMLQKIPKRKLEEVIEEVDEQLTMMSMRKEPTRPSVIEIFGTPSEPIDMPKSSTRWRGSIYKIVWVDLLMFLSLYYIINLFYRFIPDSQSKQYFEKVVRYCDEYSSLVPLSFILGFYVNLITTRWWNQYSSIPFPDNIAIIIGASVKGQNERAKIVRRTIVRYVCATFTITLTMLSPKVKKRFPTYDHFIDAAFFNSYFRLPLAWAANVVTRARHEGLIRDDVSVKTILEELNRFRSRCGGMLDYDWISVPLVYTQVVTLVVYCYFIISAIGKQYISSKGEENIDLYFPFLPVLEFFFYMGWLKVAETLINPYGDDDDDFEVVWMVDRNLQVCYLLVDKIHQEHPKLMRDMYWSETAPNSLPFTVASQNYMHEYPFPSTLNIKLKNSDQDLVMPVEETISQADGGRRRSGIYSWRLYGQKNKRRGGSPGFPLTKVVSFAGHKNSDEVNDTIDYDDNIKVSQSSKTIICEEFENLKRTRMETHKRKIIQLIELTKKEKSEDYTKIIDDILT